MPCHHVVTSEDWNKTTALAAHHRGQPNCLSIRPGSQKLLTRPLVKVVDDTPDAQVPVEGPTALKNGVDPVVAYEPDTTTGMTNAFVVRNPRPF